MMALLLGLTLQIVLHASAAADQQPAPIVILPRTSFTASDIAVIVNESDPLSVAIGEYYQRKRQVPDANMIRVKFASARSSIPIEAFATLRKEILERTPPVVQAYALTWVRPYRVDCMSITTAMAAGYDPSFCSDRCTATRWSPYFNSNSRRPYTEFGLRPAMSIAALDLERARELIDRGVASDGAAPKGKGFLVETTDVVRNVRAARYADAKLLVKDALPLEIIKTAALEQKQDVMFYFIGASEVTKLASNRFLPGAVADHLTSLGGDLTGGSQMSSLRWLEAGATGSYGTVTEPCNILGKFPNPGMLMKRYLAGETLIEAYWKSVAMPGQGIFIGDPLANPYGGYKVAFDGRDLAIQAAGLPPGRYDVEGATKAIGPYATIAKRIDFKARGTTLRIRNANLGYYQIVPAL
jgi:uncharacterized protein (TIGR03790 family)